MTAHAKFAADVREVLKVRGELIAVVKTTGKNIAISHPLAMQHLAAIDSLFNDHGPLLLALAEAVEKGAVAWDYSGPTGFRLATTDADNAERANNVFGNVRPLYALPGPEGVKSK